MAQHDIPNLLQTDPDGPDLAALLDNFFLAQKSGHSGAARPGYALGGLIWSQIDGATKKAYFYDGDADRELALLNDVIPKSGGAMSGALSLPAGGLDVGSGELAVSASGYVTRKNSPSFCAHSAPSIGNGALVFPSTDYNNGSHYNAANGRYTAVVEGPHLFSSYVLINTGSGPQAFSSTRFRKNGALLPTLFHSARDYSRSYEAIWGTKVIDLNVGDYVDVFCACGSGALTWGGDHSNFLGMFIG